MTLLTNFGFDLTKLTKPNQTKIDLVEAQPSFLGKLKISAKAPRKSKQKVFILVDNKYTSTWIVIGIVIDEVTRI